MTVIPKLIHYRNCLDKAIKALLETEAEPITMVFKKPPATRRRGRPRRSLEIERHQA